MQTIFFFQENYINGIINNTTYIFDTIAINM